MQLFARLDVAQSLDEDAAVLLIGFTIAVTGMVDPARRIATHPAINHPRFVHVEIKRVVGVVKVMRVARLRFFPGDDLAHVFKDGLALCDVLHGVDALAMNAGLTHLNAPGRGWAGKC